MNNFILNEELCSVEELVKANTFLRLHKLPYGLLAVYNSVTLEIVVYENSDRNSFLFRVSKQGLPYLEESYTEQLTKIFIEHQGK